MATSDQSGFAGQIQSLQPYGGVPPQPYREPWMIAWDALDKRLTAIEAKLKDMHKSYALQPSTCPHGFSIYCRECDKVK
jgi:hypothetical protein